MTTPAHTQQDMSVIKLAMRRLSTEWRLMSSVFIGIVIATILMSAAPVYLDALERQSVNSAVRTSVERSGDTFFDIMVDIDFIPLESEEITSAQASQTQAVNDNMGPTYTGTRSFLKTPYYSMTLPPRASAALAALEDPPEEGEEPPLPFETGFAQYLDGLDEKVTFIEGRAARDVILRGAQGPLVEAALSARTANAFGGLKPGDTLVFAPSVDSPIKVSARITGLVEASYWDDPYWRGDVESYLFPRMPTEDGVVTPSSPPLLGIFVGPTSMTEAIGRSFPGTTVDAIWYNDVDPEILRTWSKGEMRSRLDALNDDMSSALPSSFVYSGIGVMLARFERQTFLTSVPLLLLMAVLGIAVLYFLFMIVSYLIPNRESDVALFRSRGTSTWRLLRLYMAEGVILTVVAAAIAPFIALLVVWLAGLLPYFGHITDGRPLPVHVGWLPFAAAGIAGALCLAIFVIPGVLGARAGLIIHRLRSSRPPQVPILQRYYIDVMFLAVGGVLFWELQARGELVSGSLFGQQDVNEALLVAPVLFLITVGMLFFRIFPMFIRYISGESPTLVDLGTWVTLAALAAAIGVTDFRAGDQTGWIPSVAALGGFGAAYWLTGRGSGWVYKVSFTVIQAALVAGFFYMRPPDPDAPAAVFAGSIALAALIPAQVVFHILSVFVRRAPVWVSMTLWHMARNPMQYSWLVLLLVLSGGIGILATTVGATLDRSYEERIRYNVGADIRVYSIASHLGRRDGKLEANFGGIAGVESVSPALRGGGHVGTGGAGPTFSYMAIDSQTFDPWYRGDFSERDLHEILKDLKLEDPVRATEIPDGAERIQLWVNPASYYPLMFLWIVVEDANGKMDTITLGEMDTQGWNLKGADIPDDLVPPLKLVAIQLNEPGFGSTGTAGNIVFDELHAVIEGTGELVSIDGFEGSPEWVTIATSAVERDELTGITDIVYSGNSALRFTFGKESNNGLRGFYKSGGHGYIPAAVSRSFSEATGAWENMGIIVKLPGGLVPVVVVDVVEYFPTVIPQGLGFMVFDLHTLLEYIDPLNPTGQAPVNELFLEVKEGSGIAALTSAEDLVSYQGKVVGTEAALAAQDADPLISAGWRTMVLVAMAVILFIASLGYIVYLLAFTDRSVSEMASLRSLGFNRAQTIGLIGLEHLLIAFIGLGLGTWAGYQMSRMMVASVTVTDGGGHVLPPFILTTNWLFMGPLYLAMIAVFAVSLLTLGRRALSIDLRRLSRMEG